jgi:hypothetical protein
MGRDGVRLSALATLCCDCDQCPLQAVKLTSHSRWSVRYGADWGRWRGGLCRGAVRPTATSKVWVCYVRFTSTPAVRFAQRAAVPVGMANRPNRRKAVRQPLFVSRSRKILAVAPSANNGGLIALIVFEMAESPRLDDPERNAGSGIYLSITIRHGTSRELATTGTKSFVPAKVGCGAVL